MLAALALELRVSLCKKGECVDGIAIFIVQQLMPQGLPLTQRQRCAACSDAPPHSAAAQRCTESHCAMQCCTAIFLRPHSTALGNAALHSACAAQ